MTTPAEYREMSDTLRKALGGWSHYDPKIDAAQDIAATICDTLGITRHHVTIAEDYYAEYGGNWPILEAAVDALATLLELAGR
jgi:predicted aminopeptidase